MDDIKSFDEYKHSLLLKSIKELNGESKNKSELKSAHDSSALDFDDLLGAIKSTRF